jgi:hypothetical protein
MLVLARFFMPIVVGVLGWFLTGTLDELRHDNKTMQGQIYRLSEQQAQVGAAMAATVKQLDHLQTQVDNQRR